MSTLRTYNIQNPDSASVNIELTSDGGAVASGILTATTLNATTISGVSTATVTTLNATTISGVSTIGVTTATVTTLTVNGNNYPSAGPLSNRNLIINGAMQVAQRGTQVTGVTGGGYRTCDRFRFGVGSLGTWTVDQSTDAPPGFSNSFKVTCTSGSETTPDANDNVLIRQTIEAQNLQMLDFGASGAQTTTLSFWVRSNKTGNATFVILQNDNSNKLVSFQYSISSADTWEYKTITIPGDTAGVINNDNGEGLQLEWWLHGGSTYTSGSLQSTWTTFNNADRNPSNLGVGSADNDYFQITGVQLEVGETATPFEHRSYGDELARCQRYYYRTVAPAGNDHIGTVQVYATGAVFGKLFDLPVTMRATPSVDFSAASDFRCWASSGAQANTFTALGSFTETVNHISLNSSSGSNVTGAGNATVFSFANTNAWIEAAAEL